MELMS